MCKFCDDSKWTDFSVDHRNSSANENICEIMCDEECSNCFDRGGKCIQKHTITTWSDSMNIRYMHISSKVEANGLIVEPYSESFRINFCPFCGKQTSEDVVDFNKIGYINKIEEAE